MRHNMGNEWEYISGDWWVICDVCGFKHRSSNVKHRWDGLIVCKDDWETRHPLDFIKTRSDKQDVPFSRPRPTDVFISSSYYGNAVAGEAVTGQAVSGTDSIGTLE